MSKKVLIIDDNQVFINLLTDGLSEQKYEVFTAPDGEEGLKKVDEVKPDIILLDLMMPKMGGIEFLKVFRTKEGVSNIPVLILSQVSDFDKIADGMNYGVRGYIIKSESTLNQIIAQIGATLLS